MKFRYNLFATCCICFLFFLVSTMPTFAQTDCGDGFVEIVVELEPDDWASEETSWEIITNAGTVIASGGGVGDTICVDESLCLEFIINDTYGDGLINGGFIVVYYNDFVMLAEGNFGYTANASMGNCPAGSSCFFPETITYDNTFTATFANTWYQFVPDTSGTFVLSTCDATADCMSSIWIYDYCAGLVWEDSQEGGIYFNQGGCLPHATLNANLEAGELYYIRIGSIAEECAEQDLEWSLTFEGPVVGCTDTEACNYDPVATVNDADSCIYPGNPDCPNGPDLMVLSDVIESSIYIDYLDNSDACYIAEGCVAGYGVREILRFTTHIKNIGNQDYYIGATPDAPEDANEQWEWDECHTHWHYEGYAEYILYDLIGTEIPVGFKNGFCVMDLECSDGGTAKFGCGDQGITAGCGDIYSSSLACQWIDVTTLPAGIYTLVVRVNWDNSPDAAGRVELNLNNNWGQACIEITRDDEGDIEAVNVVEDCAPYVDCLGEIYGDATLDCEGNCAGTKIIGDLMEDGMYLFDDVNAYANGILNNNVEPSPCTDLNMDDNINVVDAAMLLACALESTGTHTHPDGGVGGHSHCQLPQVAVLNPTGTVNLSIADYNTEMNYLDIHLQSPSHYTLAYQLQLSGATVAGVSSLVVESTYVPDIYFNGEGTIVGLSPNEVAVNRYVEYSPFLRIFLSEITEAEICLSVDAIVNDYYEETNFMVENACLDSYLVTGVNNSPNINKPLSIAAYPNPSNGVVTISLSHANRQATLQITNVQGKIVESIPLNNATTELNLRHLPKGLYFYQLANVANTGGKLILN